MLCNVALLRLFVFLPFFLGFFPLFATFLPLFLGFLFFERVFARVRRTDLFAFLLFLPLELFFLFKLRFPVLVTFRRFEPLEGFASAFLLNPLLAKADSLNLYKITRALKLPPMCRFLLDILIRNQISNNYLLTKCKVNRKDFKF